MNSEAPKLETQLKHIDISQHWVRQMVAEKQVKIEWAPTNQMIADGFTKPLSYQKHQVFLKQLNLVDIQDKIIRDWWFTNGPLAYHWYYDSILILFFQLFIYAFVYSRYGWEWLHFQIILCRGT
jgi:hypothetical protein